MLEALQFVKQEFLVAYLVYAAFVGACVGSFLNVVVYRMPIMIENRFRRFLSEEYLSEEFSRISEACWREHSSSSYRHLTLMGRSYCPHCNTKIPLFLNIPVLSYLFLRGKSRCCQKSISARYPLIEMFTALAFAGIAYLMPVDPGKLLIVISATALLIGLALIDFDTKLLPEGMVASVGILGLIWHLLGYSETSLELGVMAALGAYLLFQSFVLLGRWVLNREIMGEGDPKLAAALMIWLVPLSIPMVALFSSVITLALALFSKEREIPYGPGLIGGFAIVVLTPYISSIDLIFF